VTQTLVSLAVVVGLILVIRQLALRWLGRPAAINRSRVVEVLSRVSVGPRQHVVLLRMGSRIIVMADSAGQMRPLANIDEPEEVASILKSVTQGKPSSISQGFGQMLGRFDREHDQEDDALRRRDEGEDFSEHHLDRTRDQLSGLLARVRAMAGKGGA
jgi:flagellar biogenesis protein FliO